MSKSREVVFAVLLQSAFPKPITFNEPKMRRLRRQDLLKWPYARSKLIN